MTDDEKKAKSDYHRDERHSHQLAEDSNSEQRSAKDTLFALKGIQTTKTAQRILHFFLVYDCLR